jgi:acetyl esterase/lipase
MKHLALALTLATVSATAQQTLPLWPHGTPEPPQVSAPETDLGIPNAAHTPVSLTNVTVPTMAVYLPAHPSSTHAAALVFPGGAYQRLAYTKEGLATCQWLNSLGMACLLVKYRVPQPYNDTGRYPADPADLEDAQQAMRLTRAHAADWHIDPTRIGVVGFSAGGNLAVLLSTHPDDTHIASTPAAADVPATTDARANFAIVVYPAYLAADPDQTTLLPTYTPNRFTPPTFLIAAGDDLTYGKNTPVYYRALLDAHVPADLHIFATGGHGFGMDPAGKPEDHWTDLATAWLRRIGILPLQPARAASTVSSGTATPIPTPCPNLQPPTPGQPNRPATNEPNCF